MTCDQRMTRLYMQQKSEQKQCSLTKHRAVHATDNNRRAPLVRTSIRSRAVGRQLNHSANDKTGIEVVVVVLEWSGEAATC